MFSPAPGNGSGMGNPGGMGGFGGGFGENPDENAIMQAMSKSGGGSGANSGAAGSHNSSGHGMGNAGAPAPVEPREVAEIPEEAKRGAEDVWKEVKQFFSINTWLGINPEGMTPEEQAEAKEFHANYQRLDQEQQGVARQMYQEKMEKKHAQEREDRQRKEMEAQQSEQGFEMPAGPQKGAQNGGKTRKQQVLHKMKQDRTTLSNSQGE
ncbi:hypothetical protein KA111_01545 [Candidatus Woesebacteria bacterium]|nr:hypothetical protein [Candidatus Woesebacteria bacterium]